MSFANNLAVQIRTEQRRLRLCDLDRGPGEELDRLASLAADVLEIKEKQCDHLRAIIYELSSMLIEITSKVSEPSSSLRETMEKLRLVVAQERGMTQ